MSDISILRHQMIFDPHAFERMPIHIIGAGATGSRVWLSLVELGLTNLHVYDFDKVEAHNLANQIFFNEDIGKPKVEGLYKYYKRKTGQPPPPTMAFNNVKVDNQYFDTNSFPGIVFLLTDTMESRREIFNQLIRADKTECVSSDTIDKQCCYMIETRMASSYGNIFGINPFAPNEAEYWISTLVDDDDESTEVSACGSSISVGPTASIIANMAVWQMIMFLTNPEAATTEISLFCKPMMYRGVPLQCGELTLEHAKQFLAAS